LGSSRPFKREIAANPLSILSINPACRALLLLFFLGSLICLGSNNKMEKVVPLGTKEKKQKFVELFGQLDGDQDGFVTGCVFL